MNVSEFDLKIEYQNDLINDKGHTLKYFAIINTICLSVFAILPLILKDFASSTVVMKTTQKCLFGISISNRGGQQRKSNLQ